jgi:hypothetical protein
MLPDFSAMPSRGLGTFIGSLDIFFNISIWGSGIEFRICEGAPALKLLKM